MAADICTTKKCTKCGVEKSRKEFSGRNSRKHKKDPITFMQQNGYLL